MNTRLPGRISGVAVCLMFGWLIIPVSCVTAFQGSENWPGFRNDGSGTVVVDSIPTNWSPDEGIAWRADIPGYGQSAPVVQSGKVFLTSSNGPWQETCLVHAFDLQSGQKIWTTEIEATTRVENYFRNSRAAPTCVADDRIVVSFFPGGDVTAMDHDGQTLWTVPLFQMFGEVNNERGTASSLAQTKDHVYVLVDHAGPSWLVAINKSNGDIAWKMERGNRVDSWASPVIAEFGDKQLVVVSSADSVNACDAATGKQIWQLENILGNHIPSASVVGNSIYVGSTQMYGSDLDPETVAGANCRIDLTMNDDQPSFQVMWGAERANSYYSTPLAFAGYVYYVNKSGILFCVNQETGKRVFTQRIGNPCWASAIGVTTRTGDKFVYLVMKNGYTLVLRPGETFDQVADNQLWDYDEMSAAELAAARMRRENTVPADQATPKTGPEKVFSGMPEKSLHKMFSYGDPIAYASAMVDGNLLIRTGQHLYCIRDPG